jgi:hypothetical protein
MNAVLTLLAALALVLGACAETTTPAPTQDVGMIQTEAAQTVVAEITQSAPAPLLHRLRHPLLRSRPEIQPWN